MGQVRGRWHERRFANTGQVRLAEPPDRQRTEKASWCYCSACPNLKCFGCSSHFIPQLFLFSGHYNPFLAQRPYLLCLCRYQHTSRDSTNWELWGRVSADVALGIKGSVSCSRFSPLQLHLFIPFSSNCSLQGWLLSCAIATFCRAIDELVDLSYIKLHSVLSCNSLTGLLASSVSQCCSSHGHTDKHLQDWGTKAERATLACFSSQKCVLKL